MILVKWQRACGPWVRRASCYGDRDCLLCAADGVIQISLQKANVAETWPCALKGAIPVDNALTRRAGHGQLNPVEQQQVQQKILLERFQREVRHCNQSCVSPAVYSIRVLISLERASLGKRPTREHSWVD